MMNKQIFPLALWALVLVTGFVACQPEQLEEPAPVMPHKVIQDGPLELDTDTPVAIDEEGGSIFSQEQWPNPLPAHARLKGFTWSERDYQRFYYNQLGQVTQQYSQYQFVQNDPSQIRKITYDFEYDGSNQLEALKSSDGPVWKYTYKNGLIAHAQRIIPGTGAVVEEVTFTRNNNRIVQELRRYTSPANGATYTSKSVFGYDDRGNLNKVELYSKNGYPQSPEPLVLQMTTLYSEFDDKINPSSWMLRSPSLPQIRWQMNNPRKKTVILAIAQTTEVTTYSYVYNQNGLPASQTKYGPGGPVTVHYHY